MKEEMEHIDDFINRKLNEQEFSYDDSYWASAEKLIIADAENRRRKLVFWSCILLIVGLFILMIVTNAFKRDSTAATKKEIPVSVPSTKETKVIASIKNIEKDHSITRKENIQKENIHRKEFFVNEDQIKNEGSYHKISGEENEIIITDQKEQKENKIAFNKKRLKRNKIGRTITTNINTGTKADDVEKEIGRNKEVYLSKIEIRNPQSEILNWTLLPYHNNDGYVDDAKGKLKSYRHFIGVHGGLLYNHLVQSRPLMGVYYIYQHNDKWAFETRFNFKSPVLNNIEQKALITEYDFGKVTKEITYKSKQSYELEIPLLLKYSIYKTHHVSAGVSVNKVLGAQYERISRREDNFTVSESREKLISSDNLNSYYLQLKAGYDLALIKPLRLELGASYNITDPVKDKLYLKKDMNHFQYHISVSYNLWRWK